MTGSRTNHETGLPAESAALIEAYFARVHGALLVAAVDECEETLADIREHVYESLSGTAGTVADVERVLEALGTPETLAAECGAAAAEPGDSTGAASEGTSRLAGTVLGVPYELRLPTPERVASRWWDPLNPQVLVPRVFGIGWDVNFGAVAVKLGIVRPDDEDVPFASVPDRALTAALALPLAVALGLAVLIAVYQPSLPAQVPVHWNVAGVPDRFDAKEAALVLPVLMTLLGLAAAANAWLRRRTALSRVAAGAFATLFATISVAAYGQQVAGALGAQGSAIILGGLALSLLLPFALLVGLSRVGRAAEMRRDLEKKGARS